MGSTGGEPPRASLPQRVALLRFAAFALDLDGCSLTRADGSNVALTHSEFALLREFVRHQGRVLSRSHLLDALAGRRADPFDRSIDVLVGRLRRKIESNSKQPTLIVTVPGEGYKFANACGAHGPKHFSEIAPAVSAPSDKPRPPPFSIVVLPFANMSSNLDQEYFIDGLTESLTTDLSRMGAFVIGRSTAFTYKGKHFDLKQIGRELNVRYVLEGSIQRDCDQMRINVQLIDAESGHHLWAERFDKPLADLFGMQDEIVARLANTLALPLVAAEARRSQQAPNPNSMDLCFQARFCWNKGFTTDNLAEARRLFERAVALDPANVFGVIGIAAVETAVALNFFPRERIALLDAAERGAIKALALAPEFAAAHLCLGVIQIHTNRASEGVRQCRRALQLDRNLANAHAFIGHAKIQLGQAEDAEVHIQEALRLSPRDANVPLWCMFAGIANFHLGKEEEAVAWLRRSVETNRSVPTAHFILAGALARLGQLAEARFEAQAGLAIVPTFTVARLRASAWSDHPTAVAARERYCDGLRMSGVPEE